MVRMRPELKTICFKPQKGDNMVFLLQSDALPFRFLPDSHKTERRFFYDTFEWQFFHHGIAVISKPGLLSLLDLESGIEIETIPFLPAPAHFLPSAISAGPFRSTVEKVTTIRALLRRCRTDTETLSWRILDREEKTIGFLVLETFFPVREGKRVPTACMALLSPLKGFQEEAARLARQIEELLPGESILEFRELFTLFMRESGQQVNDYSSKIQLRLQPDDPVRKSAARLLLATVEVMQRNEGPISMNIDTEFLHDYRVAIRRTRSLLSQLKGVFSSGTTAAYREAFRKTGKKCNALRDCDVYLLKETAYRGILPDSLSGHVDTFFDDLRATRRTELRRFITYLHSKAFRSMLAEWETLLQETVEQPCLPDETDAGLLPTITIARKAIGKAWKKVILHGRSIPEEASDSELHALRIDCKKLRYLLEFFSSIFPEKTIDQAVRQLKKLQENLGTFVDLAVQQRYLHGYIETMKNKPPDPELAAALGGLIAVLHSRQENERRTFGVTFRRFDNDETEALFKELLKH